ncbi:WD repeat-containing protein 1 [Narcine bancroftii]|uniref:WD repeat-containing protein 1 n=1 Tax=Narcine bancroftii TaxID=1343680 RepID=UPI003832102A
MSYELSKVFACLPQVERGVSKVIGRDPKEVNFLYTNNKSVIIRNIDNPEIADIYTEHAHRVHVAQYSHSGYYIASGDAYGKIRIWDTVQKEHILKYEYQPFVGLIKDICWSADNQKIAVAGEGNVNRAVVIQWDTGVSVGEVLGHYKVINSISLKPTCPFRAVTGSDDFSCVFFEAFPIKFKSTITNHSAFVNCVRYSPKGNMFATAGSDGKIFIFDGKEGTFKCSLGQDQAHNGGIYAIDWSNDEKFILSASGDKTVKLWDVEAKTAMTTFNMGSNVLDQQLGCLWHPKHLLSISLSGYINYLDKANPNKPLRVIKGHSKSIQCLTIHSHGKQTIYSGSHDGHVNYWDASAGENDDFEGKGHTNMVSSMMINDADELVSCGMDDTVRYTNLTQKQYCAQDAVKLDSQPKNLAVGPGGYTVVACIDQIVLMKDKKKVFAIGNLGYEPENVAIHPQGESVAVGTKDGKVYLYCIQGTTLQKNDHVLDLGSQAPVIAASYSPDGTIFAACTSNKVITCTVADGYKEAFTFYGHHAKIFCIGWSPDNEHFATGGMDGLVFIWTRSDPQIRFKVSDTHRLYHISSVAWLDEHTLVTSSHDACIKQWNIKYK